MAAPEPPPPGRGLAGVAARGVFWVGLKTWITRATSLVVFVVLTRLLTPQEIGLVALVYATVAILASITDMGLADYLLFVEDGPAQRRCIFWLQAIGAFALALLVFALAPWVLPALGKPEAVPVMQVLCWMIPLGALGKVHDALQRKALDFRAVGLRSLVANLASAAVGLGLAFGGFGLWALVAKQLLEVALDTVLLWFTAGWRPGWRPSFGGARPVLAYGGRIAGSRVMDTLSMNVDDVIVGFALGNQTLGFYSIGKRIYRLCSELVGVVLTQVAGPLFASQKHDRARMHGLYLSAIESAGVLVVPMFAALAGTSAVLLPWLFGRTWADVVPVAQWFCLVGATLPLTHFNWSLLQAQGHAGRILKLAALRLGINLAAIAAALPFGMLAVVGAQVLRAIVMVPISMRFALAGSGLAWHAPLARAAPGFALGAAMAALLFVLDAAVGTPLAPGLRFAMLAGAALALYAASLVLLLRAGRLPALAGLLERRRRRR